MRRVTPEADWPESWKMSYPYDLEEIYGQISRPGYAYAYDNRRRVTIDLLTECLPKGARVLDVAAAQGNFTLTLAELGYSVVWNDLRADLEPYVRAKHERGDVTFAPGNVFDLGFGEEFDGVLITEVIEHVAHPDQFLAAIAAMVKPGGYVVMTTPNGAHLRNRLPRFSDCSDPSRYEAVQFKPDGDGHIFLLWPDEIRSLSKESGLRLEKLEFFTNPLTNGHLRTDWLLRRVPRAWVFGVERLSARVPLAVRERLMVHSAARFRKEAR